MNKYLSMMGCVAMACCCATASADQFQDTDASFMNGDVFVPLITETDTDSDGVPDKLTMRYNVFVAGTNTKTLSTKPRTVAYPAIPCTNPASVTDGYYERLTGLAGKSRRHSILDMHISCVENGSGAEKEAHRAVLYSANVTGAGGSWIKSWNGWGVTGAAHVDWDSDSVPEIMLLLQKGNKGRVLFVRMSDGTIEADNIYTVAVSK